MLNLKPKYLSTWHLAIKLSIFFIDSWFYVLLKSFSNSRVVKLYIHSFFKYSIILYFNFKIIKKIRVKEYSEDPTFFPKHHLLTNSYFLPLMLDNHKLIFHMYLNSFVLRLSHMVSCSWVANPTLVGFRYLNIDLYIFVCFKGDNSSLSKTTKIFFWQVITGI